MDRKRFGAFQISNAFSFGDHCFICMILQIKCTILQSLLIILNILLIWQARITVDKTVVKEVTEVRKLV